MMPFSVLRPWGLGIFSWLLLGLGIYCGWRAIQEFRREPPAVVSPVENRSLRTTPREDDRPASEESDPGTEGSKTTLKTVTTVSVPAPGPNWPFWGFLAAAVGLLGMNFVGFLPMRWLLSNPHGPDSDWVAPDKQLWVDRPDGSRLRVRIYGPDNGPTLLLTHGWSLDVSAWDYVIGRLAKNTRIVAWDLPGLGRSRGPTNLDWSLEKMAHDLNAVLEATSTEAPVVLAGHSIGGMITQVFCRLYPKKLGPQVQGIALLQTTYVNPLRTCFAAPLATALELPLITPLNYLNMALAPLVWLSNWQSYLNGSLHVCTRISTFSGKQTWKQLDHAALLAAIAWPGVLTRGNRAMQHHDEESTLPTIDLPVLVLSGKHDRMTLPSASAHMDELLPAGRLFQVSSGHLGMWECPQEFATALTEFVHQVAAQQTFADVSSRTQKHFK